MPLAQQQGRPPVLLSLLGKGTAQWPGALVRLPRPQGGFAHSKGATKACHQAHIVPLVICKEH